MNTHYLDTGPRDGLPVILIHGFPFSHEMWQPQIAALAETYRVIAYDVRGHGQTPAGDGQYTLEFFVDDLFALLDQLGIDKPVICGLSMGGYIALRAIERAPERFRALVLADTQCEADSNEAKLKRAGAIKTVKEQGIPVFAEAFLKNVFAPATFEKNPEAVAFIRRIIEANPPAGICGALLALASRTDTSAVLPGIPVPTLLLVGEHDMLAPPAVMQAMAAKIPGATCHAIPNAAHMSNLENAVEFNERLLGFLRRQ